MSDTPENIRLSASMANDHPVATGGPPADDPLPGMHLGDYLVEKAVAWGGMGIVYRAVHPLIGHKVAVKVLRPSFASDPEQMSRFLKEAKAVASIKHRGIIDIIGFGKIPAPDGRQYMVMEFLEGESLESLLLRDSPMSANRVLAIADELLDALSAAHKVGVVHRDLKPANVFITEQTHGARYVKLVDFGLARVTSASEFSRGTGKASMMAGTPEYVAPEQARGLAATPPTDLYCLGVMLFEMLTGRLPFAYEGVLDLLNAHVHETAPLVSTIVNGVPPALEELVAQLLEKAPDERPSSADVARQKVQRIQRQLKEDSTTITSRPAAVVAPKATKIAAATKASIPPVKVAKHTTDQTLPLPAGRPVWLIAALGAVAIAIVVLAIVLATRGSPEPVAVLPPVAPTRVEEPPPPPPPRIEVPVPVPEPVPEPEKPTPEPVKLAVVKPVVKAPVSKPVVKAAVEKTVVTVAVTLKGQRSWAFIDLNGERLGDQAPTQLALEPGTYKVRVSQPGIDPVERKVTVGSDKQMLLLELQP